MNITFALSSRQHRVISLIFVSVTVLSVYCCAVQPTLSQKSKAYFFSTTLIAPTGNPIRVQYAQLITNEIRRMDINANLILVGWDVLLSRMFSSLTHAGYNDNGFDIGFIGWRDSILPSGLFQFFHSSNIDPLSGASNYYPVNNETLDGILELIMNTTDFDQRKGFITQALKSIVWDIHPVTGIYQDMSVYYLRDNVQGFDSNLFPNPETMYFDGGHSFGHGKTNELIVASITEAKNFNPLISNSWYDAIAFRPIFSQLLELNSSLSFVPALAEGYPYPIHVINNYTGLMSSSNINTATVWELKLRDNIYWHEGYGYRMENTTHRDILRVDADDVVWYYKTNIDADGPPNPSRGLYQYVFGTDPEKAIVKVDQFTVQFHLKNLYADLFAIFGTILPQHILDPTYDAGYGSGIRADGTIAPSYEDWTTDDYNIGKRTSGDTNYPATIGNGAYMLHPGINDFKQEVILAKWNHYFKDNVSDWSSLVINRPDKYIYTWITSKDAAEIALELGNIDIMDAQFAAENDYPVMSKKPGLTANKDLNWGYQTVGYNILNGAGVSDNKWIRLAISHVVPRQQIIDNFLGGLGESCFVPFPKQSLFWSNDLKDISYNYTKALEYLEKAGFDVTHLKTNTNNIISGFETIGVFFSVGSFALLVTIVRRKYTKTNR